MSKVSFPVTDAIREELEKSGVKKIFWNSIDVEEDSYKLFREMVESGGYSEVSDHVRHAIAIGCCYTHPNHKDMHLEPLRHPIKKASLRYALKISNSVEWNVFSPIVFRVMLIVLLIVIASSLVRCQTSQIDVIKFQNSSGTTIRNFASPFTIKCDTNLTCSVSGSVLTMQAPAGGGSGTVTSVSGLSPLFTVANATTTPTFSLSNAAANTVYGNNTGSSAAPAFFGFIPPITKAAVASNWLRSFDSATGLFTASQPAYSDISGTPQLAITKAAVASNWLRSYDSTTGLFTASQPAYSDISSTPQLAITKAAVASNWLRSYDSTTGLFTASQPAFTDISGVGSCAQEPALTGDVTSSGCAATIGAGRVVDSMLAEASSGTGLFVHRYGATITPKYFGIDVANGTRGGVRFISQYGTGSSDLSTLFNACIADLDANGGGICDGTDLQPGHNGLLSADVVINKSGTHLKLPCVRIDMQEFAFRVSPNKNGWWVEGCTSMGGVGSAVVVPSTYLVMNTGLTEVADGNGGSAAIIAGDGTADTSGGIISNLVIDMTADSGAAVPPSPVIACSNSGGSLATGTYFIKNTFSTIAGPTATTFGETLPSAENSCALTGPTGSVTVTAPTLPSSGIGAYTTYSSTTTNTEKQQTASAACVNITGNCVIQVVGAGAVVPAASTAWDTAIYMLRPLNSVIQNVRIKGKAATNNSGQVGITIDDAAGTAAFGNRIDNVWISDLLIGLRLTGTSGVVTANTFTGIECTLAGLSVVGGICYDIVKGDDHFFGTNAEQVETGFNISSSNNTIVGRTETSTVTNHMRLNSGVLANILINANQSAAITDNSGNCTNTKIQSGKVVLTCSTATSAPLNIPNSATTKTAHLSGDMQNLNNRLTFDDGTITNMVALSDNANTFNQPANKLGQADIVADSAAINTTETILVKTPALAANRLIAGTHIRMTLTGTCTASAANTSTFTIRMGTLGTTGDAAIATPVTAVSAITGTNIPFKTVLDFTVRTAGASGTGFITMELVNQGITGISTLGDQILMPAMSAFNTTTASNILSVSYKSAATTTTSTFKNAVIEIVQN